MRHFRWTILIAELIMLAVALAVPRMNDPETAFNEADTPVNQATVTVVLGCRSALGQLRTAATAAIPLFHRPQPHSAVALDLRQQEHPRSRSLTALLCTLLC